MSDQENELMLTTYFLSKEDYEQQAILEKLGGLIGKEVQLNDLVLE